MPTSRDAFRSAAADPAHLAHFYLGGYGTGVNLLSRGFKMRRRSMLRVTIGLGGAAAMSALPRRAEWSARLVMSESQQRKWLAESKTANQAGFRKRLGILAVCVVESSGRSSEYP